MTSLTPLWRTNWFHQPHRLATALPLRLNEESGGSTRQKFAARRRESLQLMRLPLPLLLWRKGLRRGGLFILRFTQTAARISRFGFRFFVGLQISKFGFSLLAQTNSPASDDLPPLLPPRPEILPSFWEQHQVAIALIIVVLAAAVCAGVWFVLRPKPPVLLTPAVQARAALEPLRGQPETGMLLSKISQIVRSYFAAAFHLPAGELTTAEFCRFLQNRDLAGPELSGAVGEFLRQCDHRKFAPLGPLPPLGAVAGAAQLIEEAEVKRAGLLASVGPS
ncbi:MAG TPA: hypothetical protein VL361_09195 [Candidatus Limnocylindrales bacterium]|nr:hypothetical protein [Candidatus Limnocylindrales bacterium]